MGSESHRLTLLTADAVEADPSPKLNPDGLRAPVAPLEALLEEAALAFLERGNNVGMLHLALLDDEALHIHDAQGNLWTRHPTDAPIPLPDHSTESVLIFCADPSAERLKDVLEQASRVLRPGGHLHLLMLQHHRSLELDLLAQQLPGFAERLAALRLDPRRAIGLRRLEQLTLGMGFRALRTMELSTNPLLLARVQKR